MGSDRGYGRVLRGIVTSNKMEKSITVEVTRTVRHQRYKKFLRVRKSYRAHDAWNVCSIGDQVEIVEASPISKTKRWRLQRVVLKVQI